MGARVIFGLRWLASAVLLCLVAASADATVNPLLFQDLKWRSIGPFRGGRVLAVTPGHAANLITGLDLTGGIARAADGSLRVVSAFLNMDFTTTGKVLLIP